MYLPPTATHHTGDLRFISHKCKFIVLSGMHDDDELSLADIVQTLLDSLPSLYVHTYSVSDTLHRKRSRYAADQI